MLDQYVKELAGLKKRIYSIPHLEDISANTNQFKITFVHSKVSLKNEY